MRMSWEHNLCFATPLKVIMHVLQIAIRRHKPSQEFFDLVNEKEDLKFGASSDSLAIQRHWQACFLNDDSC